MDRRRHWLALIACRMLALTTCRRTMRWLAFAVAAAAATCHAGGFGRTRVRPGAAKQEVGQIATADPSSAANARNTGRGGSRRIGSGRAARAPTTSCGLLECEWRLWRAETHVAAAALAESTFRGPLDGRHPLAGAGLAGRAG